MERPQSLDIGLMQWAVSWSTGNEDPAEEQVDLGTPQYCSGTRVEEAAEVAEVAERPAKTGKIVLIQSSCAQVEHKDCCSHMLRRLLASTALVVCQSTIPQSADLRIV